MSKFTPTSRYSIIPKDLRFSIEGQQELGGRWRARGTARGGARQPRVNTGQRQVDRQREQRPVAHQNTDGGQRHRGRNCRVRSPDDPRGEQKYDVLRNAPTHRHCEWWLIFLLSMWVNYDKPAIRRCLKITYSFTRIINARTIRVLEKRW